MIRYKTDAGMQTEKTGENIRQLYTTFFKDYTDNHKESFLEGPQYSDWLCNTQHYFQRTSGGEWWEGDSFWIEKHVSSSLKGISYGGETGTVSALKNMSSSLKDISYSLKDASSLYISLFNCPLPTTLFIFSLFTPVTPAPNISAWLRS